MGTSLGKVSSILRTTFSLSITRGGLSHVLDRAARVAPGVDLDRALRLAGALEDEEMIRKLELRK